MKKRIGVMLLAGLVLSSCASLPGADKTQADAGYQLISVDQLQKMMNAEDFTLVNVHIPLEGNLPGTDETIAYDVIGDHLDQLPADKDAKIVLYCRSGSMSRTASETLLSLGFTNVLDLAGGYNAWVAKGLPFEE